MNQIKLKIGIIKEGKVPTDSRVPLTPKQCVQAMHDFPIEIVVETCPTRCYSDEEYRKEGIEVTTNIVDCDLLMGVKEVPVQQLIPGKTYLFFSHTIKKQPYNRKLIWAILEKNIRLIDYEVLKDEKGNRLIAFGRFAGMVGAHNALWTYGKRTGQFSLPRMKEFLHYVDAVEHYKTVDFPAIKIVLTGTGRVATGAAEVLRDMGIKEVGHSDFLSKTFKKAVFTQLHCFNYVARKDGSPYQKYDFYHHPERFESIFAPYFQEADVMINGIFWDSRAPVFFKVEDMKRPDFNLKVIADVTCDIAPVSSIPSTIRASTIADPVFGFDPNTSSETAAHTPGCVDMMTIDNLPNELPRDASEAFGQQFLKNVLPELLLSKSKVIEHGTIAENGHLTKHFRYMEDYANAQQADGLLV